MQKKIEISLSIVVSVFPALAIYYFLPGISLAFFLLWLLILPLLLINKRDVNIDLDELRFLFSVVSISIVSGLIHLALRVEWFDFTLFYHNLFAMLLCLVPLCFITNLINVDVFVKSVIVMGLIASVVLIWQWISLFYTGDFQNDLFLPWLEINRDMETFTKFRPSSFFTEPAHFAIYILPAFQMALSYKKRFLAYLFAISILFSGSSTGFILMFVLLLYHLYRVGMKKWYIALFGIIILLICGYIVYALFPEAFFSNLDKLDSVKYGNSDSRLLGPLRYMPLLHPYEHFFGITLNQLSNFLTMCGSFGSSKNYANAAIYMYISYGVTGLIALFVYVVKKFRSVKESYGFLLIFIGIVCSDQILFNGHYFYLLTFVLLTDKIYKRNQKDCIKLSHHFFAKKNFLNH